MSLRIVVVEPISPGPLTAFAAVLAESGHDVTILTGLGGQIHNLRAPLRLVAHAEIPKFEPIEPFLEGVEPAIRRARTISLTAASLAERHGAPDLIVGLGDGSTILLGTTVPEARVLVHVDRLIRPPQRDSLALHHYGATVLDRDIAVVEAALRRRVGAGIGLVAATHADWSVCIDLEVRSSFPAFLQPRLSVLPPVVDREYFSPRDPTAARPGPDSREAHVGRLNVETTANLAVFAVRAAAEIDMTWASVADLQRRVPTAVCVVMGPGGVSLPEVGRWPIDLARLHLLDRPDAGVRRRLYLNAAVLVYTDRSAAWPVRLVEAMACGAPVVAVSTQTSAALIEHGKSGLSAAPEDPAAVGLAAVWAIEQRTAAAELGVAARLATARFGIEETADTYVKLAEWVASGAAGPLRADPGVLVG